MIDLIYRFFDEARGIDRDLRRREQLRDIILGIGALALVVAAIVILLLAMSNTDPFVIRDFKHLGGV